MQKTPTEMFKASAAAAVRIQPTSLLTSSKMKTTEWKEQHATADHKQTKFYGV